MTPVTDAAARLRKGIDGLISKKRVCFSEQDWRDIDTVVNAALTEAASQPREGDGLLEALDEALKQYTEPMSMMNSHELGERLANDVAEIVSHSRARAALTQRPPEQAGAGAVRAGWKLVPIDLTYEPAMREAAWKHIDNKLFHGLEVQLRAMWYAMLSAAPTPLGEV